MKTFGTIMKILAALAAIAGAIYVAATYGDKIVAWAKKLVSQFNCCCCCCDCEECIDEVPAEEAVQAEETDFEG